MYTYVYIYYIGNVFKISINRDDIISRLMNPTHARSVYTMTT